MASAAAYFAKGHYENSLPFTLDKVTDLKLGLKQTTSSAYYWTIFDNFRLYYYGDPQEDIEGGVETGINNVIHQTAVYDICGKKVSDSLEELPRGLYIRGGKKVWVK